VKPDLLFRYRVLVVLAHAATVLITWPLWTAHTQPPMLPALPLPSFGVGVPLLLTIVAQLFFPRRALAAYAVVLLYACICDETRLQPQFFSFPFLTLATWPEAGAQFLGRAHVVILWLWAGALKLLSPAFIYLLGPLFVRQFWPTAPDLVLALAGILLALGEYLLAMLVLSPQNRRYAGIAAFAMHVGILSTLAAGRNENASIWPWNFALALSGVALFMPWQGSALEDFRRQSRAVRALALTLLLAPFGWYFGLVDAYLSYHLYSVDVPVPDAPSKPFRQTWKYLNVPIPPEHRLFVRFFDVTCFPGETLTVRETRTLFEGTTQRPCPRRGPIDPRLRRR
jgi:hypothetical protein